MLKIHDEDKKTAQETAETGPSIPLNTYQLIET